MDGVLSRAEALQQLAITLAALQPGHVPRVAIDGPDAAGKTTLADELAGLVSARRPVIRASIDGCTTRRSGATSAAASPPRVITWTRSTTRRSSAGCCARLARAGTGVT